MSRGVIILNIRFFLMILAGGLWSCRLLAGEMNTAAPKPVTHVLCLVSEDLAEQGLDNLDPKAMAAYRKMGFELHFDYYQRVSENRTRQFPVVVGMMPMLHAGTRAIDDRLGPILSRYVQDGGGFALLPAPSYYGAEDFVRQLNPWLRSFGAELLNEQPRDPANQRVVSRILAYRYLLTSNFARHPVTQGIKNLWLPLDYTDALVVTHTMKLSPEWNVLIRGEKSCQTYLYQELCKGQSVKGAYSSEPPLLAVRDWGRGRLAIFTTSSQYYLFDAYHWAYGEGMVMEKGQGLKLMTNLFAYLAGGQAGLAPAAGRLPPPLVEPSPKVVTGNVSVCSDKSQWLGEVMSRWLPPNHHVAAYVDCGSLTDLPYDENRGYGYTGDSYSSWLIRWSWSEIFHPTAANSRGFDIKPLEYRFDALDPAKHYQIGVLVWAYQTEGARSIRIKAGGEAIAELEPPRFADRQGPSFTILGIPPLAISSDGKLTLTFERGEKGSGTFSSISELWLFEEGAAERRTADEIRGAFESPSEDYCELVNKKHCFKGLIGARSPFSDGKDSIANMCLAAREAGFQFLVFLDDLEKLSPDRFERLRKECARETTADFVALPGIRFSARYDDLKSKCADNPQSWGVVRGYVFQNLKQPPPLSETANAYQFFWKFLGGEFCDGHGSPPTLRTPLANDVPPFHQRFWRGFDVMTAPGVDGPGEDARSLYQDLLASGYGPFPRVSGSYRSAAEIREAGARGWFVLSSAPKLAEVDLYHHTFMISNGPLFKQYAYSFDYARDMGTGDGILIRNGMWVLLHTEIESPTAMDKVTLYSGRSPLRVWYPGGKRFAVQEPLLLAGNHELWLHVQAQDGLEAYTGRFLVQDRAFPIGMCADNQNTICSLSQPPSHFERDDRELYLQHSYWHTGQAAGQLGTMCDTRKFVPRVIEAGIIQPIKLFHPAPVLRFADGSVEDHIHSELRILNASAHFNQVEYRFDTPGSRARSQVKLTSYRPASGGDTTVLVEQTIEAKTELKFAEDDAAIQHLEVGLQPALDPHWKYTYRSFSGKMQTGSFGYDSPDWMVRDALAAKSGVLLWPNDVGSLLVLPLDDHLYRLKFSLLKVWNGRECVGFSSAPRKRQKGDQWTSRFLVVLHQGPIASAEDELEKLRKFYTESSAYVSKLDQGRILSSDYPLVLEAEHRAVRGILEGKERRDPLPVRIEGVNANWSCGLMEEGRLILTEAAGAQLHAVFPTQTKPARFFAGNLLLGNKEELRLEWGGVHAGGVRIHAHNPLASTQTIQVATHPALEGMPRVEGAWTLREGESVWLWGLGRLLVKENGALQIDAAEPLDHGRLQIKCHGEDGVTLTGAEPNCMLDGAQQKMTEADGFLKLSFSPGHHTLVLRPIAATGK